MNVWVTGDIHRNLGQLRQRIAHCKKGDIVVLLGDVGANYLEDDRDYFFKQKMENFGITFLCVHGNHEARPESIETYRLKDWNGGKVYVEKAFPHLLFAKSGEIFTICDKTFLIIGGAYSVDKPFRLQRGYAWWPDEQLNEEEKDAILKNISPVPKYFNYVCTHTAPLSCEPKEALLEAVDQSQVDKRMEIFLDEVQKRISYDKWFCGHYHIDKSAGDVEFIYEDMVKVI